MTITLELTPEQESILSKEAEKLGIDPQDYLIRAIEDIASKETTGERLLRLGILGGVSGTPRRDGRPWSEIEGFE